jgi:hypothetical protein
LEEVSIKKSVSNCILYLHEFSRDFSQLLAISFELFSFGIVFNSGIICRGVPPVSLVLSVPGPLVSTPSPRGATRPCPRLKGRRPNRDDPNAAATSRCLTRHPDSVGPKPTAPPPLGKPRATAATRARRRPHRSPSHRVAANRAEVR